MVKILDKYPDWKSNVFGDEPREKLFYKHKNLKLLGFKKNSFIYEFMSSMRQKINDPLGQRAKKRKEISQR